MAFLSLRGLRKTFGKFVAIDHLDLEVEKGEFVVLVGPSGCGKSTILRLIAGLEDPSGGALNLDGRDLSGISPKDRDVAMVFQSYALYPHMTVFKNIAFGLRMRGVPRAAAKKRVAEVAQTLGLEGLLERYPAQLSGGQRQRVALGRAIIREPKLFLLDEPLSNLDAELRVSMRAELLHLHARLGVTTVYVTHDQVEAMTLGDRLVVLNAGKVEQTGTPEEIYRAPRTAFVARFLGNPPINLFPAALRSGNGAPALRFGAAEVELPPEILPSGWLRGGPSLTILAGLRPEALQLVAPWPAAEPPASSRGPLAALRGTVELIEKLGKEKVLFVRCGELTLQALAPPEAAVAKGGSVELRFSPSAFHLFDPQSGESLRRQARA
ncbi:MAG: ABC transporter ATP-binding protein [Planctomycetes bacterium]|nr:ABC transporter ATP-binding protein [Planctomycetota bacterium]